MKKFLACFIFLGMLNTVFLSVSAQNDPYMDLVYSRLRYLWHRENVWGIQEVSSDECFFPTRGTNWFDGGLWIDQYLLAWEPTHRDILNSWNTLINGIEIANMNIINLGLSNDLEDPGITEDRAQSVFVRAFFEYYLMDIYGLVPVYDPFSLEYYSGLPDIKSREQGFHYLTKETKDILSLMITRDNAEYGIPNRDAALMLLAKLYLNKEVYTGETAYDSCLLYLNELIASGNYGLADDYYDMFSVDNDTRYKTSDDEAILVIPLDDATDLGVDDRIQWVKTTFHYNQHLGSTFSNWNGCAAPQSYLEEVWFAGTDTATDTRWQDDRIYEDMGVVLGFNEGQQYDAESGDMLYTRNYEPLIFTVECPLQGAAENQGVRVLKYPPRIEPVNTARTPNDFIIWRYADVLLMKAECEARLGNMTDAVAIVNEIRIKRNAPAISASSQEELLKKILIERGLELYWEGHRRQDLIRFGRYLGVKSNKDFISTETALICPIPESIVQSTCNYFVQNPGYSDGFTDDTGPIIICPDNITIESNFCSVDTANVFTGIPYVQDNCSIIITLSKESPAYFSAGKNRIIWTAVDEAGNSSQCAQTVTVNCLFSSEEITQNLFTVYPNPSPGKFIISSPEKHGRMNIEIFNTTGQIVYKESNITFTRQHKIDLSKAEPGVYYIQISDEQNRHTMKIVIQ